MTSLYQLEVAVNVIVFPAILAVASVSYLVQTIQGK